MPATLDDTGRGERSSDPSPRSLMGTTVSVGTRPSDHPCRYNGASVPIRVFGGGGCLGLFPLGLRYLAFDLEGDAVGTRYAQRGSVASDLPPIQP